jgi:hypothetical protein
MKNRAPIVPVALALLFILNLQLSTAFTQGTAFTYQGQLQNNGSPVNGSYDLQFTLYATNVSGTAIAGPVTNSATAISNGLFTVTIDFGPGVFTGTSDWLDIAVRTNSGNSFTELTPRQPLTPAPYSIFAESANAAGLSGTIPPGNVSGTYNNPIYLNNAGNSFTGNGSGLTGVNSAALGGLGVSNFWQTGGNSGTSPTNGSFLGTTDTQPIELRVGGLRGWRVEPDSRGDGAANLIGGYISNAVQQPGSGGDFIGGGGFFGGFNLILTNSSGAFIGAGSANQIGPNVNDSVIGGGFGNIIGVDGARSVISGGNDNTNDEFDSVIGGGQNNFIQVYADHAFIGGGYANVVVGAFTGPAVAAVIGGGQGNVVQTNAYFSFIGGGFGNTIQSNTLYAVIPGGSNNVAGGVGSFAAGTSAQATNNGAFVWADASASNNFSSTTANQFNVRAMGGVRLVTGGTGMTLDGQGVVPSGNYVFAYSSAMQNVFTPSSFQDAIFNTDAQLSGWTHAPGTSQYFCAQTGLYLIQYTADAFVQDSMSMRGTVNLIEVPGSQAYASLLTSGSTVVISKSFIAAVNAGGVLTIQYTGNSSVDHLAGGGFGLVQPSISLTLTRIQ